LSLFSSSLLSVSLSLLLSLFFFIFEIFDLYDFGLGFISDLPPIYLGLNALLLLLLLLHLVICYTQTESEREVGRLIDELGIRDK
jgi:hypothetical protein